jgi:hypothetical protein
MLAFAVELAHLFGGVTVACRGVLGDRALDGGEIRCVEPHVERANRVAQLLARARSDQRHIVVAALQHPRDRALRDAHPFGIRDATERLDQREVPLEVAALEAREVIAGLITAQQLSKASSTRKGADEDRGAGGRRSGAIDEAAALSGRA